MALVGLPRAGGHKAIRRLPADIGGVAQHVHREGGGVPPDERVCAARPDLCLLPGTANRADALKDTTG